MELKKLWYFYTDYVIGIGMFWILFPFYYIGCQLSQEIRYNKISDSWKDYWEFNKKDIEKHFKKVKQ